MNAPLALWPPKHGKERFLSRRFTDEHVDLDIDFDLPRPELVTSLLASCLQYIEGENINAQSVWDWTVSERLQGLLAIANASTGDSTAAVAICSNDDCRGKVELELGLSGFADESTKTKIDWLSPDGAKISCRLPTGQDQRAWHAHAQTQNEPDEAWFVKRLIEQVTDEPLPSSLPPAWIDSLGTALETADPLTALTLDVACPFCNQALEVEVDLELLLIEGLRLQQRRLIEQVHRLANHYHWSEGEIVTLPHWRREKYLSLIAAEFE